MAAFAEIPYMKAVPVLAAQQQFRIHAVLDQMFGVPHSLVTAMSCPKCHAKS
jgi:hypothetical protein